MSHLISRARQSTLRRTLATLVVVGGVPLAATITPMASAAPSGTIRPAVAADIISVAPTSGSVSGGTVVTITTTGLADLTTVTPTVTIGGVVLPGASVSATSSTELQVTTPASMNRRAGAVAVQVTAASVTALDPAGFLYRPVLETPRTANFGDAGTTVQCTEFPVTGACTSASKEILRLGPLASRTQGNEVTTSGSGPAYQVTGVDSRSGEQYSFETDFNYASYTSVTPRPAWGWTSEGTETVRDASEPHVFITPPGSYTVTPGAAVASRTGVLSLQNYMRYCDFASGRGGAIFNNSNSAGTRTSYCSLFGPEVYSEPFYATSDSALSFDWVATGTLDFYEVYGFLVRVDDPAVTTALPTLATASAATQPSQVGHHSIVMYARGQGASSPTASDWRTATGDVPVDGYYRFRFVNGSFDKTGGWEIGAIMNIDPNVVVALKNAITFDAIPDQYTAASQTVITTTVSATSGEPVTVTPIGSSPPCTASVSGTTVTVTVSGAPTQTCTLSATQGTSGAYAPAASVTRTFSVLAPSAPSAPTITQATSPGTGISVTFTPGADGGSPITDYEYSVDGGAWVSASALTSPMSIPVVVVSTAPVTVSIRAINAIGTSPSSNVATVLLQTPSTPSDPSSPGTPPPSSLTTPERVGGASRVDTSVALSREFFPSRVSVVYLATAATFADALVAGPAAGLDRGPVLLTERDSVPAATLTELRRLNPQRIVVVGGESAIAPSVFDSLTGEASTVIRIGGDDRYETAVLLSRDAFPNTVPVAYVATGEDYADAVSGGPASGLDGAPILLVRRDSIPSSTIAELRRLAPRRIVVLGLTDAVSAAVEASLAPYAPLVERIGGATRYDTSAALSASKYDPGVEVVFLATGTGFADALSAVPPATITGGPVLLTRPSCVPQSVLTELRRLRAGRLVVLGGESALSDDVANLVGCLR